MPGGAAERERFCSECNAPQASVLCLQCRDAAWCSIECQRRGWLAHKGSCRERVKTESERRGWEAPAAPEPQAAGHVAADQAWHPVPERCCVWELPAGGSPEPVRTEATRDNVRWQAVAGSAAAARVQGRVSVVVPTLQERYRFHPQLWLCFRAQTYVDKELIIVDSGESLSPFFSGKQGEDFKYVHVGEPLSVGEKRNIAIREHSTGEIIVNFDDDDIYFPAYIQTMVNCLKASKAALVHLSAWNVLDLEMAFCATFDRSKATPSEAEAHALGELSGFSMVYTHAAWRSVTWPPVTLAADRHFLCGALALGLPVATRAETGRAMTVLHLQHGRNMGRSVCQKARTDTGAVKMMIERFEEACRRILSIPQTEYDQMGGSLLYQGLCGLSLTVDPPAARGLFLLTGGDAGDAYREWEQSSIGIHPEREGMLQRQQEHLALLAQSHAA